MAIEDGYQLSLTLDKAVSSAAPGQPVDIENALKTYTGVRLRPVCCGFQLLRIATQAFLCKVVALDVPDDANDAFTANCSSFAVDATSAFG